MSSKKITPVKLEQSLTKQLQTIAERLGVTRTQIVTEAIRAYLALLESGQCVVPDRRELSRIQGQLERERFERGQSGG